MFLKKQKTVGAVLLSFSLFCSSVPVLAAGVQMPAANPSSDAEEIAAAVEAPEILKGDAQIAMPDAGNGGEVRFLADYEQVIGEDGTIYQPLETRTVKGFYESTAADGSVAKTEEFTLTVPGQYKQRTGENPKPNVIPSLQEWHGGEGSFVISSAGRILAEDEALMPVAQEFAKDYKDITGMDIEVLRAGKKEARIGDFYLSLTTGQGLLKEGYTMDIGRFVTVEAETATGAYWATRSILQILKYTEGSIPKGVVKDYPKYEVRGLNLDVARKPFTMDVLYDFVKNMSWYKLNSFQVHLSDNLIFMEDYASREEAIAQAYAGYRLESDITNGYGESATSTDVYYTKDEFCQFMKDSRVLGVDIVPELDFPAHALAFTRVFKEFMSEGFNRQQHSNATGQYRPLIDELDLAKEGAVEFAKEIWSEYLDGDNPVFGEGATVHIGTDEFHGGGDAGNEYFRSFSNELITYIQSKGRTVRMWGSLTNKKGETPVASEGVQANIWSVDYGRPKEMYDLGYDLINTADRWLYMVPNGTNARGMYNDYLQVENIYNNWNVNTMYEDTQYGFTVPAGDKQMLGACFAIWHDNIDTRASGISQYDSFIRFMDTAPAFGEKLWGDGAAQKDYVDFKQDAAALGIAPNTAIGAKAEYITNTIARYTFEDTLQMDSGLNGFSLGNAVNARTVAADGGQALVLNGGKSYVDTPFEMLEPGAVLTMKVKLNEGAQGEQVLCESKGKFGTDGAYAIKAAVRQTGNVGFSREGHDYSFDYKLPPGEWVELSFCSGENKNVSLRVKDADGETVYTDLTFYYKNHPETEMSAARGNARVNTLLIPFGRIGSDTQSFQGEIAEVAITGTKGMSSDQGAIPHSEMTVSACSEAQQSIDGTEGPAVYAIDGREDTYWHTNWNNDTSLSEDEPHYFEVELAVPHVIDRLSYLPRQDSTNGRIYRYSIEVTKPDGTVQLVVDNAAWAKDNSQKTAYFEPVLAKCVKLLVYDAQGNQDGVHATIAELNLYEPDVYGKEELKAELLKTGLYQKGAYTDTSWAALEKAKAAVQKIIDNKDSTQDEYAYANGLLQQAISGLNALADVFGISEQKQYQLAAQVKAAEIQISSAADYTAESAASYQKAITAAKKALVKENVPIQELDSALSLLLSTKLVTKLSAKRDELTKAVADAKQKLSNTAGYTAASVEALRQAVDHAQKLLGKENVSLMELTSALNALQGVSLVLDEAGGDTQYPQMKAPLTKGEKISAGGYTYQVADAVKKEAVVVKGKNTKTVKIGATVKLNGVSCKITGIMDNAFKGYKKVKTVTVGGNVKLIGKNAFQNCSALNTVTLGKNVKTIKMKAFYNCKKLKKAALQGKRAPKIEKLAFKGTAAKISIMFPKKMPPAQRNQLKKRMALAGVSEKASYKVK